MKGKLNEFEKDQGRISNEIKFNKERDNEYKKKGKEEIWNGVRKLKKCGR